MVSICGKIIPGLAVFSNHFYNFAFGLFWLFFLFFFDCFVNHFGLGDSSQKEAEPLFSCCREADLFAGLDLWLWMPGKKFRWAQGESPMSVLSDSMRQPICCPLCGWYTIYIYFVIVLSGWILQYSNHAPWNGTYLYNYMQIWNIWNSCNMNTSCCVGYQHMW